MKRQNCPFCGNRWIRSSTESPIHCPNCDKRFYPPEEIQKNLETQINK